MQGTYHFKIRAEKEKEVVKRKIINTCEVIIIYYKRKNKIKKEAESIGV